MVRFVRFWAIRLLGREFMAQSAGEIFVGSWLILSVILLAGFMNEEASFASTFLAAINFFTTCGVVIRHQNTNKSKTKTHYED